MKAGVASPNGVVIQVRKIASHCVNVISLPPIVSTLALLCSFAFRAEDRSQQSDARTPGTLFAAIDDPMPAPSITTPQHANPWLTISATFSAMSG